MTYAVKGLDPAPYQPLLDLSDEQLASRGVVRMSVTEKSSFPCRVSLTDRDIGERVLLINHVSHDVLNPYRASHAIFIAEKAKEAAEFIDEVPSIRSPNLVASWVRQGRNDGGRNSGRPRRSRTGDTAVVRQSCNSHHPCS